MPTCHIQPSLAHPITSQHAHLHAHNQHPHTRTVRCCCRCSRRSRRSTWSLPSLTGAPLSRDTHTHSYGRLGRGELCWAAVASSRTSGGCRLPTQCHLSIPLPYPSVHALQRLDDADVVCTGGCTSITSCRIHTHSLSLLYTLTLTQQTHTKTGAWVSAVRWCSRRQRLS